MKGVPELMRFNMPTSWIHGRGVAARAGQLLRDSGAAEALVLTDQRLVALGVLEPATRSLEEAGIRYDLCGEVAAEPAVAFLDALAAGLALDRYQGFVAVGGGSVIDSAKGLRLLGTYGGSIKDYAGLGKIPGRLDRPLIAIPTTAGTGSEVSDGAVFTDEAAKSKFAVAGRQNAPTVALTDPEMTRAMPPRITAITGIDALVHAVESYVSRHANLVTDMFAERAIELIGPNLERAVADGGDLEAREAMQIGATLAIISGFNAFLGLCHAMAMPLCGLYKLPHGQACGIVLPYALEYNAAVRPEKTRWVLQRLGCEEGSGTGSEPAAGAFRKLERMVERLGLKLSLTDHGFSEDQVPQIVSSTLASFQSANNPREVTREAIEGILTKLR